MVELSINVSYWVKKFVSNYDSRIVYYDNDDKFFDNSPFFESASKKIKGRNFLRKEEFISIGVLRAPRAKKWYQENSEEEIREVTKQIIDEEPTKEMIQKLTNLKGVGIPVATTILTVIHPNKYCTYTFNSLRTLIWINNNIGNYQEFHESMEWLKHMNLDGYLKYLKNLRELTQNEDITVRELETALQEYDKQKGIKPPKTQKKLVDYIKNNEN